MTINSCIPTIPSFDLEKSLKLWRDGLGFTDTWWEQKRDEKLVGCGIGKNQIRFMLNIRAGTPDKPEEYEGIRFYWAPDDLYALRDHLIALGFAPSEIIVRDYGQTEFFLTDDDGFSHCFGVATPL